MSYQGALNKRLCHNRVAMYPLIDLKFTTSLLPLASFIGAVLQWTSVAVNISRSSPLLFAEIDQSIYVPPLEPLKNSVHTLLSWQLEPFWNLSYCMRIHLYGTTSAPTDFFLDWTSLFLALFLRKDPGRHFYPPIVRNQCDFNGKQSICTTQAALQSGYYKYISPIHVLAY